MKKFLLGLAALAAIATPIILVAAPVRAADNPGCITRAEFRAVPRGSSLDRAAHIIGGRGLRVASYGPWQRRAHRKCGTGAAAVLEFQNGRLAYKQWSSTPVH